MKLPEGKILIPGVVTHHTNVVEHPEVVADRIIRYASLVGRENVIGVGMPGPYSSEHSVSDARDLASNLGIRFVANLLLLFPFAGIAYEGIRLAGKFRHNGVVNMLFAPGLATQLITTAEPDPDQIEVALTALKACIDAENHPVDAEVDDSLQESIA